MAEPRAVGASSVARFCSELCSMKKPNPSAVKQASMASQWAPAEPGEPEPAQEPAGPHQQMAGNRRSSNDTDAENAMPPRPSPAMTKPAWVAVPPPRAWSSSGTKGSTP